MVHQPEIRRALKFAAAGLRGAIEAAGTAPAATPWRTTQRAAWVVLNREGAA
jgi:hypothetical protein